jgi:subtilisin family serine protease
MRSKVAVLSVWILVVAAAPTFPAPSQAAVATERVVVVFHQEVADPAQTARDLSSRHDATLGFVYRHALKGFSAEVPADRLAALSRDPRVAYFEPDHVFQAFAQSLPTGIDRSETERNPHAAIDGTDTRADVDIAVIDTGIDYNHPDLYVTRATDCTSSVFFPQCSGSTGNLLDEHGHGTHVAGSAAALDNDIGVVGVAPGARLWSVKVLDQNGSGYLSWIIAGIDTVTQYAAEIDVANMSLGCECASTALDDAITNSVAAGVVYAVAAGNSGKDASSFSPANHPDVITVSALADFDGLAGAAGSPTCREDQDDTLADFSNFGPLVELAAPGVCIISTWLDGTYHTISGTSMASPHVAGSAALYIAAYGRDRNGDGAIDKTDVDAVRATLVDAALPQSDQCGYSNEHAADGSTEPLLFVNAAVLGGDGSCGTASGDQPPTVTITSPADGAIVSGTVTITANASDDHDVAQVEFFVDDVSLGVDASPSDGWSVDWDTTTVGDGAHAVTAVATDGPGQTGSDSILVTVDNLDGPPTVTITEPGDGEAVSGTVTVVAEATDDEGVTQVEFSYQADGGTFPIGTDTDGSDGWSVAWDTTSVSDGGYGLTAAATDTSGQTGSDSISVTVDNTAPFVSITSPSDGESVSGTIEVSATASDESPAAIPTSGVTQVEFFVDEASIGVDADGSDGWSVAWDTTTVDTGSHTVAATATDGARNTASDSVTVTVENAGDPNAMYVWDIAPSTSRSGPWTNVLSTVTILRDADADGAEGGDEPVSGAEVTYRLERDAACDGTYESVFDFRTDKTDNAGTVGFNLKTRTPDGCWRGTVIVVNHGSYTWDSTLDSDNPREWRIEGGSIVAS